MPSFIENVEDLRKRAEKKIEDGAVTTSYKGDVEQTISILNEALATEIVCVLRYMHHYFMATGVHGMAVRDEFKEHADAEREHADKIAERIQELGGKPDFNPGSLVNRSVSQYVEGETLADMIKEDLIAERIVIEVYQKMIRHFGNDDPTTRIMIEHILREEEEHASDLSDLLFIANPKTGESEGEDPGTHPLDMHHNERSRQQRGATKGTRENGGNREPARTGQGKSSQRSADVGDFDEREDSQSFAGSSVARGGKPLESQGGNRGDKGQAKSVKGREPQVAAKAGNGKGRKNRAA